MTNWEWLKMLDEYEFADWICEIAGFESCYACPGEKYCFPGHKGLVQWLKEERKAGNELCKEK